MKALSEIRHIETDVLIVGAGVAGMLAVVGAKRAGISPIIATKGAYASGSSSMARGGHSIAVGHSSPDDNPKIFFEDIVKGSHGIGNPRLIDVVAEESLARSAELDAWGLGLVKDEKGHYDQKPGGAPHRYDRLVHCGRLMGKPLMNALSTKTKSWGTEPLTHVMFVDLMMEKGRVVGAWGFTYREGTPVVIHAKSTVIAAGGAPQIHALNDSPPTITGDGYAMAYRAGADLIDMEFIDYQIVTAAPEKLAGYPPYSTGLLGAGGHLLNGEGERFMAKYDPENMEHSSRALTNRAMALEVFEGRATDKGNIQIDVRHIYDKVNDGPAAGVLATFAKAGLDLANDCLEVTSCPHTYLGGIRIDEWGRTNLDGLYVGGEAAGGIHGANRLGGLALIDSYVFGLRSGMAAALESKSEEVPDRESGNWQEGLNKLDERVSRGGTSLSPDAWRKEVQSQIVTNLGQVRRGDRLLEGLDKLNELERQFEDIEVSGKTDRQRFECLRLTLETHNLICVGRMLGTAALARTESRGGHFRLEYPEEDENFLGNLIIRREGDTCAADFQPVPPRDRIAAPPPGEAVTDLDLM